MAEPAKEPVERKSLDERNRMTDLQRLRHSCAHIMATAVTRLWPDALLNIWPPTEEGFYYDFDLPSHRFAPEDFPKIEAEMQKVVKENQVFEKSLKSRDEAKAFFESRGQKYKVERLADIPEGEDISFYQNGEFIDLCAGPHVMRTGNVKAFKLLRVAAAYYRGNEKNQQLQRLYGTAFPNKTELEAWLTQQEEAKKRDHRKIGKEMELFRFDDDVGPVLPLWMTNGTVLVEELEKLAKETDFAAGYQRVRTPHLAKESMYKTSGHLPYYAESMFPPMKFPLEGAKLEVWQKEIRTLEDKLHAIKNRLLNTDLSRESIDDRRKAELEEVDVEKQRNEVSNNPPADLYYLKAMNCPHHHKIFGAVPRSY